MKTNQKNQDTKKSAGKLIIAAGGIIWKHTAQGPKIAVIHRSRYGDWTLPKGKQKNGESCEATALREVKEETGIETEITGFADMIDYTVKGVPKVVLFWHMIPKKEFVFQPCDEVKEMLWLSPKEAIKKIDYPKEKALLRKAAFKKRPVFFNRFYKWWKSLRILPKPKEYHRLSGAIKSYSLELNRRICRTQATESDKCWSTSAQNLLKRSEAELNKGNIDEGWKCFHGAQRMEIFGLENKKELAAAASILRQESSKLGSWRKKATHDLIGSPESPKKDIGKEHVYRAALLRDEHYNNTYYKIKLLRIQLTTLSFILFSVISGLVVYFITISKNDNLNFENISALSWLLGVALFGLLGGTVSAIFKVRSAFTQSRIPELISNYIITFMRVFVGAASAIIIYIFLKSGLADMIFKFDIKLENPFLIFAISFVAGFTERLVIKAVEAVAGKEK